MSSKGHVNLSRRERQIMDILHRLERVTAQEVLDNLPAAPGYSAVRALLRLMEEKGYVTHEQDGPRYVYKATLAREKAGKTALKNLLQTFFDGSTEQAVAALLDLSKTRLSQDELDRLSDLIDKARKEGR
ncbi:MAG: BlaI/MecI/CopY family transcriptional regulator [Blastocatellia bacterium]